MYRLSPVLPSDTKQRSSCPMTKNQIHVVLKKRCIVPLAFPLSFNRKSGFPMTEVDVQWQMAVGGESSKIYMMNTL